MKPKESTNLVIVFVKNIKMGKVKTRLAKTIGDEAAFQVYNKLVNITEQATEKLTIDRRIYFSDAIVDSKWPNDSKEVQRGKDLGERMLNAFIEGFNDGYKNIVLIGSDLPDISSVIIENAFAQLKNNDVVFGPAEDGGYYLVGMSKTHRQIFKNKPWSQPNLLKITLDELKENDVAILEILNDIDTLEDLKKSKLYKG
ncbi:MAG: TIGR04282 family arsenosugar biosynthesis glycosyltransferase [Bacteroidia bacterium]|nr:TIGR04282 family arsenosugar biosynthesis glycosyltransferase [Bacteroidia bacterium]NNJ54503.1 glycosyltransferase [Bacteroidia bacterium]